MDIIPGFAPGIVRDNADPEGTGRVRVEIPGVMQITPYWVMPGNWPAQGDGRGAQAAPPDEGAQVAVIFEYGQYLDPGSHAFYFTGYYGITAAGASNGPTIISAAPSAAAARKRTCLWESTKLTVYIVDDPDGADERLVLQSKISGSKIELNAADGPSGKAESIYIEARTLLSLYAKGMIDIRADGHVQIQGRRVSDLKHGDL
jgi:hypothetical protein